MKNIAKYLVILAAILYSGYHYKNNTILSEQPGIFKTLFGNEGVLDTSRNSVGFWTHKIQSSTAVTVVGSIKLHDNFLTNKDLEDAFISNPKIYVGTESRLSEQEKVKGLKLLTDTNYRLDRIPAMSDRVFGFSNCTNSHLKILLNHSFLIIGNTNYDSPRLVDGTPYLQWYGEQSSVSDLMITIESKDLINQFAAHLIRYLPDEVKQPLTASFSQKGVNLETTVMHNAFEGLTQIQKGKTNTILAWGPEDHKALLLNMINGAKESITLLQQDLQDTDIQKALAEKAKNPGITIYINMSRYPFRKPNLNVSIPFLNDLSKHENVRVNLVDENNPNIKHIHSKVMVIDDAYMYLGSANFFPEVLNPEAGTLNAGVITSEKKYLQPTIKHIEKIINSCKTADCSIQARR